MTVNSSTSRLQVTKSIHQHFSTTIKMASEAPDNNEQPSASQNPQPDGPQLLAPPSDPKVASRKDTSLREFLNKIDDYAPIVRPAP